MGKRNTLENIKDFIEKNSNCKLIDAEYLGYDQKLKIRCECGEIFETPFGEFKCHNKRQCNKCGNKNTSEKQKYTFEEVKKFIEDTSDCELLSTEYKGINDKLKLKCECSEIFYITFAYFKYSSKKKCSICTNGGYNINYVKKFVEENSESVLISEEYNNMNHSLKFQCKCGNIFERSFGDFKLNKRTMCQECSKNKLSIKEIRKKTQEVSNCKLISDEYINSTEKLNFMCECGNMFSCSWDKFIYHNQRRCKICTKQQSKGEYNIEKYLINNDISYKTQYMFDDCKNESYLRFDFAIFNKNEDLQYLIEFDGVQHYKPYEHFGGEKRFERQKMNDSIKNEYCKKNNIKLIRIPYWKMNKVGSIIKNI